MKKKYYITAVEENTHKAYSAILTPGKMVLWGLLFVGSVSLAAWPVGNWLREAKENRLMQQFHQENLQLKATLQTYHRRLADLETNLNQMVQENPYFSTLSSSEGADASTYGVGGPAQPGPIPGRENLLLMGDAATLTQLESQIALLRSRITLLDTTLTKRMTEISHYPSIRPARTGWVTSGFGTRLDPFTGKRENHPGLDISLPMGTAVYASADGVVITAQSAFVPNKSYGRYIVIDHGHGYETLYGHLSKILVKKGQKVKRWDLIAQSGNSGKSTAPHLHYGVYAQGRAQDPLHFILE